MKNVVGMFETRAEAESAIHRMKIFGIGSDAFSIAMRESAETSALVESTGAQDMTGEGTTAGIVSGAAVGTVVGLALLGSTLVLPGIGPFLIGGPLAAALTGAGIGAASGGILGALIESGLSEHEAEHFAAGIEEGHIFVSAQVSDDLAPAVTRIFDEEGSRRTHLA